MISDAEAQYVTNLGDRIGVLTAQINSLNVELAAVVGAFDEADGWHGLGFRSMAHWLGIRAGWTATDASRIARVGARMDLIPTLTAAADRGEVSLAMLDAAARVTTAENEEAVADVVRLCTPSQAGRVLASYRRVKGQPSPGDCMGPEPDESEPLTEEDFWWREWIDERGRGRIDAAIDPATLERLQLARAAHETDADPNAAVEPADGPSGDASDAAGGDAADGRAAGAGSGRGDYGAKPNPKPRPKRATPSEALLRIANAALDNAESGGKRDNAGERYVVQVTADLATLAAALGIELHSKFPIGLGRHAFISGRNGAIRQLTDAELAEAVCDATLQLLIHEAGVPLWLGNEVRDATRHQRRALKKRCHNTCEYPGCTNGRYLQPHHVRFHTDGGPTGLDNLLMLCWTHHHKLHQGRFEIRAVGHQVFGFYDKFGTCLGSNSIHGPQPAQRPLHHNHPDRTSPDRTGPGTEHGGTEPSAPCAPFDPDELDRPECEAPDRHLRLADPDIPKSIGRGERLTHYGLDVLVTKLLLAS